MWLWWAMMPFRDLTDVTLVSEDAFHRLDWWYSSRHLNTRQYLFRLNWVWQIPSEHIQSWVGRRLCQKKMIYPKFGIWGLWHLAASGHHWGIQEPSLWHSVTTSWSPKRTKITQKQSQNQPEIIIESWKSETFTFLKYQFADSTKQGNLVSVDI